MIQCPFCEDGLRTVKLLRFLMSPEVPRHPWEYPEPRGGWVEEQRRCVVCQGTGKVEEPTRPVYEPDALFKPIKVRAEVCSRCGSTEDPREVQMRVGSLKFIGPIQSLCLVCRARLQGSWRWPREKVSALRVMEGGAS